MQNVLQQYGEKNVSMRIPCNQFLVTKITSEVLEFMSVEKIMKPSIYASEIRERLMLDGVLHANELPTASQINKRMRCDLINSKKKLSVVPSGSNTPGNIARQACISMPYQLLNHTKCIFLMTQA